MQIKMLAPATCVVSLLTVLYSLPDLAQPASTLNHNGSLTATFDARRAQAPRPTAGEVPFVRSPSGSIIVFGVVNGAAVKFLLDSGADLVTIPRSLAARLVSEADFISYATFVTADGSKHKAPIVRLRSLTVGGITLANVECVISGGSNALLGQSFLKKLDAFSIDYQRNVLKLGAQP